MVLECVSVLMYALLYQCNLSKTNLKCIKKYVNTEGHNELIGIGDTTFLTNYKIYSSPWW